MIRYLLLLVALCHADILIGDKPCLWKRAVTGYRCHDTGKSDTLWMCGESEYSLRKTKRCGSGIVTYRKSCGTDTVSWETYWDSCPRGK